MYRFFFHYSILGRIIRVTDEVIDYRKWIKETFPLTVNEMDSLSSSTGSDASTLSAPASDTVTMEFHQKNKNNFPFFLFLILRKISNLFDIFFFL